MKKTVLFAWVCLLSGTAFAQDINKLINVGEVERIERTLSADDMQGRKVFTPGIDKAGDFIAGEFKRIGLKYFNGLTSYKQSFSMVKAKFVSAKGTLYGQPVDSKNIIAFTSQPELKFNETSGYERVYIPSGANFNNEVFKYLDGADKNYVIMVDTSFRKVFPRMARFKRESFRSEFSTVFVLADKDASNYEFEIKHEITELKLANIVGVLPGKSKKEEFVVFSGHYDHLGIGKPNAEGDSIYNGANDDAAGITAVIMLADYFSRQKDNERTLVFVAFTAEESGGYGSRYFSRQLNADKVMAMFNIEMIGTESKWGANSAYITGYERSDMGRILQANLADSKFRFEPDPYPEQQLFYRSDNATLAALGVPAHTISTSKMDNEPNYHSQNDEIETLDMNNMTEIIKAIAISSKGIVSGKDTPGRVEKAK